MWIVKAKGYDTGKVYVYRVDLPWDASETTVIGEAYAAHGSLKRQGMVPEFLGLLDQKIEWVNNV